MNGNIYYQIFCGIRISPENQLINYKLIDRILLGLSKMLKIQEQQKLLADVWKAYMKNPDIVYTDASCYENLLCFPTDVTENGKIDPKTRADDIKSDEFDRKIRESPLVDSDRRN